MREEIKFKTSVELAEYLLMKGDLYTTSEGKLFVDKDNISTLCPFRYSRRGSTVSEPFRDVWDVTTTIFFRDVPWEENLKDGVSVLCYVSDHKGVLDNKFPAVVISSYDSTDTYPYKEFTGTGWKYATPVTDIKLWTPDQ